MIFALILCSLVAVAWGAPAASDAHPLRHLPAVLHEEVHDKYGQYSLRYVTVENTIVSERGRLVPGKEGNLVLEVEGEYQYIGDDGKTYLTKYRGGADGFHVEGQHLPQPVTQL